MEDNSTDTESLPATPTAQSDEFKRVSRLAYGLTVILVIVFIVGVSLYGIYGGSVVTALTEANGEVLVVQARTAAKAGSEEEALDLYTKAVQGSFSKVDLKIWAMEEFVRYLLDLGRPQEAIPVMVRAVELGPDRASAYDLLVEVFVQAQDHEQALKAADLWIERLQGAGAPEDLARARRIRNQIADKVAPQKQAQ